MYPVQDGRNGQKQVLVLLQVFETGHHHYSWNMKGFSYSSLRFREENKAHILGQKIDEV